MGTIQYPSTRDQFTHFSVISTRWRDMDYRQHINHAAYLTYMENARLEYADHHFDQNLNFILASLTVDYHSQLFHPANLDIGQKVVDVGNKSFKMLGAIFQKEEADPVVTTLTSLVCFDYKTQKTCPIPEAIRNKLNE